MRPQKLAILLLIGILTFLSLLLLRNPAPPNGTIDRKKPSPLATSRRNADGSYPPEKVHPVARFVHNAEKEFEEVRSRQSKTLKEAVKNYRRRYGMHPPPNFDKWFEFAQSRNVQLIDEFDTIYHSLLPFWAVPPKVIRARAREAMGFDNAVFGLMIRDGKVTFSDGGGEGVSWLREATEGMMSSFVQFLPDMDLVFNTHDEPRVVIPSEDLQRLVDIAKNEAIPAAAQLRTPMNRWSERPLDLNRGDRVQEVRTTRFNRFAHQPTWTHSRISCPVDTPARSLDEEPEDDIDPYAYGELGFIYNSTSFSDICLTPSLQYTYGFFDRPNAFDIVHDLFPIFSQSKISSFQDIIFPSPWYWAHKVPYDEAKDFPWDAKENRLYWRGSTTGGFSRAGGWRRQHRQIFVQKVNALDNAVVLSKNDRGPWQSQEVARSDYRGLFDVKFTFIGQCDPEDCAAQQEFFEVAEHADQQEAWASRFLVDIDGNAFSGRFYAFLFSNSLVFKIALFREWHDEWLKPWVHYIPWGLKGKEYVESVRYFASEDEGKAAAPRIAQQGQTWAQKVLRNEDLEVWFFRLLLEYVFSCSLHLYQGTRQC